MPDQTAPSRLTFSRVLPRLLLLLTVFGPISMDLYLPVLPALTTELRAATSAAQLTITACLLGLAIGQVIAGPLSDRFGRRSPLLAGVVAYILTSALCALSPTIEHADRRALRAGPGRCGGHRHRPGRGPRPLHRRQARALLRPTDRDRRTRRDRRPGPRRAARHRHRLARPVRLPRRDRRADPARLPGRLPRDAARAEHRTTGGLTQTGRDFRRLLSDRVLLGAVLVSGLVYAALFAYLSGATYVLQGIYGLSPQGYSFAFGLNSLGFMLFGFARRPPVPNAGPSAAPWSSGWRCA